MFNRKKIIILIIPLVILILTGCADDRLTGKINKPRRTTKEIQTESKVIVEPAKYNFGDIVQSNGPVSKRFTVINQGSLPIKINRLSTSCGCTTATMDQSDLRPGEKREMKVEFDPMAHPDQFGPIKRVVYLQTSDLNYPEIEIDITGNVIK